MGMESLSSVRRVLHAVTGSSCVAGGSPPASADHAAAKINKESDAVP